MGIVSYAVLAYLITAVISYLLIGIIVLINSVMNRKTAAAGEKN